MISQMEKEAFQAPEIVEKQLKENQDLISKIAKIIRNKQIYFIQTLGRGSSRYAALFAKYLFETNLNILTAETNLSVRTIYKATLNFNHSLVIAISQSGQSPDLIEYLSYARKNNAITIAIVNDINSTLAKTAEIAIPMHAGPEKAVAATKSFIASLSVIIQLVANITMHKNLLNKLTILPSQLNECSSITDDIFLKTFEKTKSLFVIARGFFLPIAKEVALKFKETCLIHAEAFSSAEVMHGPLAIVKNNFASLFFFQNDASKVTTLKVFHEFSALKAKTFAFIPSDILVKTSSKRFIITPKSLHQVCDPLVAIQTFYPFCAKLSMHLGNNPDKPTNLSKITKTR